MQALSAAARQVSTPHTIGTGVGTNAGGKDSQMMATAPGPIQYTAMACAGPHGWYW